MRNKLSTGDRMRAWEIQQGCFLSGEGDEIRAHLFFSWEGLKGRLGDCRIAPDWTDTLDFISSNTLSALNRILLQMVVFQSCLYHM